MPSDHTTTTLFEALGGSEDSSSGTSNASWGVDVRSVAGCHPMLRLRSSLPMATWICQALFQDASHSQRRAREKHERMRLVVKCDIIALPPGRLHGLRVCAGWLL